MLSPFQLPSISIPSVQLPDFVQDTIYYDSGYEESDEPQSDMDSCFLDPAVQIKNYNSKGYWPKSIEIRGQNFTLIVDVPPQHVLPGSATLSISWYSRRMSYSIIPVIFLWKIPPGTKEINLRLIRPKGILPFSGLFIFQLVSEEESIPLELEDINVEIDGAFVPRIIFIYSPIEEVV